MPAARLWGKRYEWIGIPVPLGPTQSGRAICIRLNVTHKAKSGIFFQNNKAGAVGRFFFIF